LIYNYCGEHYVFLGVELFLYQLLQIIFDISKFNKKIKVMIEGMLFGVGAVVGAIALVAGAVWLAVVVFFKAEDGINKLKRNL
jgi:hypothetical protein